METVGKDPVCVRSLIRNMLMRELFQGQFAMVVVGSARQLMLAARNAQRLLPSIGRA